MPARSRWSWSRRVRLAEQMRAGGAGLGGFLTPTGMGTVVAEGKPLIEVDGRTYLLEKAIRTDVALVRAHDGDTWGNLRYRGTASNYNPVVRHLRRVHHRRGGVPVQPR